MYLALLFVMLGGMTLWRWQVAGPKWLRWDKVGWLGKGLALGLAGAVILRLVLYGLGSYQLASVSSWIVVRSLALALGLAAVEEFVFRGYLFGVAREQIGRWTASIGVSGVFAIVHLFRPGESLFKLGYGLGLLLTGLVLAFVVEKPRRLWPAIGLHAGWVAPVLAEGQAVTPSWWAGLQGEPVAGVLGWLVLGGLVPLIGKLFPTQTEQDSVPSRL